VRWQKQELQPVIRQGNYRWCREEVYRIFEGKEVTVAVALSCEFSGEEKRKITAPVVYAACAGPTEHTLQTSLPLRGPEPGVRERIAERSTHGGGVRGLSRVLNAVAGTLCRSTMKKAKSLTGRK